MAITTTITDDFADRFRDGVSVTDKYVLGIWFYSGLDGGEKQDIKVALYTSSATLDANTVSYTTINEISGQGYTAGGLKFSPYPTVTKDRGPNGDIHTVDFPDAIWTNATFTARGAMVYRSYETPPGEGYPYSVSKVVAIFDFGGNFVVTNGTFTIVWPPATLQRAAIRIIG